MPIRTRSLDLGFVTLMMFYAVSSRDLGCECSFVLGYVITEAQCEDTAADDDYRSNGYQCDCNLIHDLKSLCLLHWMIDFCMCLKRLSISLELATKFLGE